MIDLDATIAALCAAIDAGDDAVLPILADALEEMGSSGQMPSMLRWLRDSCRRPFGGPEGWGWICVPEEHPAHGDGLLYPLPWEWLRGGEVLAGEEFPVRCYPTRSAAYLALAEALSHDAR